MFVIPKGVAGGRSLSVCVCVTLGLKGNLKVWNRGTGHLWHFPSNEEDASRC